MAQNSLRMTDPAGPPAPGEVEAWIGGEAWEYWLRVESMIERNYPGVFAPEWLFGGKKHGWSRRYKKGKSFCTLIPERNRFALLIVFGAEERAKVEMIRQELSERTRRGYDGAATYHDGKWLLLTVDADEIAADVERLLAVKRKPRNRAK
ncbi:MAG TPA: DUF3788 domain-containing protein [Syntrophales bacterium]|nr:DUF3788 domain-containing protein [Syntrophales bacterium]